VGRQSVKPLNDSTEQVYQHRFTETDVEGRNEIWRELAKYLQRYVRDDAVVMDLACDRGHFIRHISAREKWASDVRDMSVHLPPDIRFVQAEGVALAAHVPAGHFDAVFMSNYLEHLDSSEHVVEQFRTLRCVLKAGGRVIVLQPNISLVGGAYWDFIDHHVALTDKSLTEAAELAGFRTRTVIRRFLPYTTKSRLPQHPRLVRAYLSFRPAWLLLGKQTLYVGESPERPVES
jgi:ubiquinone/menaquinone biosynthesis C-methylase UbiE